MTRSILTPNVLNFINQLDLTEEQQAKFRAFAGGALMEDERVAFAGRLLRLRTPRPEIRDRLMAREELSRRHAYRVIEAALAINKNCAKEMAHKSG